MATVEVPELTAAELAASGTLKIGAVKGILIWHLPTYKGSGDCSKKGTGAFKGKEPQISTSTLPGEYELTCERTKATLKLYDKNGGLAGTFTGYGLQKGLTGTWKGKWSRSRK